MASLLDLARNVSKLNQPYANLRGQYSLNPQQREPTQYEREMAYFAAPRKEEELQKRRRIPLLQTIFDVLQTGNYMSANVADSIIDSVKYGKPLGEAALDAVKSAWRGLTWQDKSTFADVIRQNADEHGKILGRTYEEWTQEDKQRVKGETRFGKLVQNIGQGFNTPAERVGLLGDILLDPLTYISPLKAIRPTGMATTAARAAAGKYAPDVVKLKTLTRNFDSLKGSARQGIGSLDELLQRGGRSLARENEQIFQQAYKRGLTAPAAELEKEMKQGLSELVNIHMQRTLNDLQPPEVLNDVAKNIEELVQSVAGGYAGAGTRAGAVLPMIGEVGVSERQPNIIARGLDRFGQLIRSGMNDTKLGNRLTDAWWSRLNDPYSIVGAIRRTFGIRNPYQKYLNQITLDARGAREAAIDILADKGNRALQELGEDNLNKAVGLRGIMEQVEFGLSKNQKQAAKSQEALKVFLGEPERGVYRVQDALRKLDIGDIDAAIKQLKEAGLDTKVLQDIKRLGIDPNTSEQIANFWDNMDEIFKEMRDQELELVNEGLFSKDVMGEWINYIPKVQNRPRIGGKRAGKITSPAAPSVMEATQTTFRQSEKQGIELAKEFFGGWLETAAKEQGRNIDDVAREFIEKGGLAPVSTNLVEMVNARILAHGRIMGRGRLLKQLREFGINMNQLDLGKFPGAAVNRMGDIYNQLSKTDDPALQNLLFDQDVADILNKTYAIAASDDSMQGLKRYFMNFTSWWKGLATATTGFHLRNFFSNNVTGIFRHGGKWLDPRMERDAMIGVFYGLHPTNYVDIAKKNFNISEPQIRAALGREIGGKTIKEWADIARNDGVISLKTMIGDVTKEVKPKVSIRGRLNPFSKEFALPAGSRAVGTVIENEARFKSYLLSIDGLSKSGVAPDAVQQFAKLDTKKWFIDYSDLTEAEQKWLKPFIPFYTWMRKNVANQLSGLMLMPEMYRLAAKAEDAVSIDDFDFAEMPEYMKEQGWIPVARGEEGLISWWPNLPYADLNKIPLFFEDGIVPHYKKGALLEEFGSSSNPIIKTIMQELTGKNLFRQRDFLDKVDAPIGQVFAGSPQVVAFLDKAMKMAGFENGAGINVKDGKLEIDERLEQVMSNNIPLLRTMARVFDLGVDITGIEDAIESTTGRKSPYEGMEELFQHLSTFLGVKFKEVNAEYEKELMARAIEEAAQKDRNAWRRTLPGYAQRSAQYGLQREAQRRRIGL